MPALPVRPSFSQLQKQAKSLRKDCQSGTEAALSRLRRYHPDYADAGTLSDIEFHRILQEVGALLGKLHPIPTEGFGPLDGNGRGPHKNWRTASSSCWLTF
jgi:hypothetical protein